MEVQELKTPEKRRRQRPTSPSTQSHELKGLKLSLSLEEWVVRKGLVGRQLA